MDFKSAAAPVLSFALSGDIIKVSLIDERGRLVLCVRAPERGLGGAGWRQSKTK